MMKYIIVDNNVFFLAAYAVSVIAPVLLNRNKEPKQLLETWLRK